MNVSLQKKKTSRLSCKLDSLDVHDSTFVIHTFLTSAFRIYKKKSKPCRHDIYYSTVQRVSCLII